MNSARSVYPGRVLNREGGKSGRATPGKCATPEMTKRPLLACSWPTDCRPGLDCYAPVDQHVTGQASSRVVRKYPSSTDLACSTGHTHGRQGPGS
jgi:hypothetical protein